jgi:hypothetical protein
MLFELIALGEDLADGRSAVGQDLGLRRGHLVAVAQLCHPSSPSLVVLTARHAGRH